MIEKLDKYLLQLVLEVVDEEHLGVLSRVSSTLDSAVFLYRTRRVLRLASTTLEELLSRMRGQIPGRDQQMLRRLMGSLNTRVFPSDSPPLHGHSVLTRAHVSLIQCFAQHSGNDVTRRSYARRLATPSCPLYAVECSPLAVWINYLQRRGFDVTLRLVVRYLCLYVHDMQKQCSTTREPTPYEMLVYLRYPLYFCQSRYWQDYQECSEHAEQIFEPGFFFNRILDIDRGHQTLVRLQLDVNVNQATVALSLVYGESSLRDPKLQRVWTSPQFNSLARFGEIIDVIFPVVFSALSDLSNGVHYYSWRHQGMINVSQDLLFGPQKTHPHCRAELTPVRDALLIEVLQKLPPHNAKHLTRLLDAERRGGEQPELDVRMFLSSLGLSVTGTAGEQLPRRLGDLRASHLSRLGVVPRGKRRRLLALVHRRLASHKRACSPNQCQALRRWLQWKARPTGPLTRALVMAHVCLRGAEIVDEISRLLAGHGNT